MYMISTTVEVEVPFHDVDAMNIVWHGYYLKYFEQARCALLRLFDYDYPQMQSSGYLWPIVDFQVKYIRPARYGQRLTVEARLLEYENRLKIGYTVRDSASGEKLTTAQSTMLAINAATQELQFVSPPILLSNLERVCGG